MENRKDLRHIPYLLKPINTIITNNISAYVVNAFGGNSGDFVIRGGVLEKYTGAAAEVVIPNNVTIIGEHAFDRCAGITSVTIPNSVREIKRCAFSGCENLTEIALPEGIKEIPAAAFGGSGISHIAIPQTGTTIGYSAFASCKNLKQIILPEGLTDIKSGAFAKSGLTSIVIPESVSIIGGHAFQNCDSLKQVTVLGFPSYDLYTPDDYTPYPFEDCKQLTTVIASEEWKKATVIHFGGRLAIDQKTVTRRHSPKGLVILRL